MKLYRTGDMIVGTRITGPSHNYLGLEFSEHGDTYIEDLAEQGYEGRVEADEVNRQIDQAVKDHASQTGEAAQRVRGIRFLSSDTPGNDAYYQLTIEMLRSLPVADDLELLGPT